MTATVPAHLDLDALRAKFPALRRMHGGHPVAYFDGPGGTQVPLEVAAAMQDYLLHHNANTHWAYPTSVETDAAIAAARSAFADFLGASPAEIAPPRNASPISRLTRPTLNNLDSSRRLAAARRWKYSRTASPAGVASDGGVPRCTTMASA